MAGSYVQLSRVDFEDWLNSIGFRGKWHLKPGRGGVYVLLLSDNVGIEINSTTGSRDEVMNRGRASMSLRLVSLVTGQVLNRKAMGQKHFARTINWRKNWAKGVDRMRDAYNKSRSWYDALAEIEDRNEYKAERLAEIEAIPGWRDDSFLADLHAKVVRGGILTRKQREDVEKAAKRPVSTPQAEDPVLQRMRNLYSRARRDNDQWTMDFVTSLASRIKGGRPLTPAQERTLNQKFRVYRIANVQENTMSRRKTAQGPVSIRDAEVMLFMIDQRKNTSKFYEMRVVPAGRETRAKKVKDHGGSMSPDAYVLERRWGRLTDSGSTGRVDSINDIFGSERQAIGMMQKIMMEKTRKGYNDVSRKREYPIGLGAAGFGWGGQEVCRVIPELQQLLGHVQEAQTLLSPLARVDNAVARKVKGYLDPLEMYLQEQLSHCR